MNLSCELSAWPVVVDDMAHSTHSPFADTSSHSPYRTPEGSHHHLNGLSNGELAAAEQVASGTQRGRQHSQTRFAGSQLRRKDNGGRSPKPEEKICRCLRGSTKQRHVMSGGSISSTGRADARPGGPTVDGTGCGRHAEWSMPRPGSNQHHESCHHRTEGSQGGAIRRRVGAAWEGEGRYGPGKRLTQQ